MPTHAAIAERAYRLWIERGRPHGSSEEDWNEAERRFAAGARSQDDEDTPNESAIQDAPNATSGLSTRVPTAARAPDQSASRPNAGEVTVIRQGKTYGATYRIEHGLAKVRTHTETRSIELGQDDPAEIARAALDEIVSAQPRQ